MKPARIIHIDYGSKGNAGLYLVQMLKAYSGPIPVDAYAHSEFPRVDTHGRVIRLLDNFSRFIPWNAAKQALKCVDLYMCFAWIAFLLRRQARKQKLFVFVQFFQSFHAYEWFFRRIARYCTLIVTVHDAVELNHSYPAFIMSARDEIIKHAHFIIVHGAESVQRLQYLAKPIYEIPFPLFLSEANTEDRSDAASDLVCFLFIGHIRAEKGVDVLVDAWRRLPNEILNRASLIIAGTYNKSLNIDFSGLENCSLVFEYLDDNRFVELIRSCHYVLMPYLGGTNSGVLSIATALNRPCITTQIPLFTSSSFFEQRLSIVSPADLDKLLIRVVANHADDYQAYLTGVSLKSVEYQSTFFAQLRRVYDEVVR